mmetsp:Transcript_13764/g.41080  ORF Transcript_13764/g.41080 Transcript_13764/m.41080 type:complete len:112 (-) Transcript_13764:10-345(-)
MVGLARAAVAALICAAGAFHPPRAQPTRTLRLHAGGSGQTVRVKFRIHPDGRIEETVSGIKGSDCTKVTEELNEKLGQVIATKPTEEMYQQKVEVEETATESVYDQNFSEW